MQRPILAAAAALAAAVLSIVPASALEPNIYIAPTVWLADLDGNGHTGSGSPSEEFDVSDTFGFDTSRSVPSLEAFVRWGRNKIQLGFNKGAYSGDNRLDAPLDFDGTSFPANRTLHTEMDYDRRRLLYGRPSFEWRRSSLGFMLGLDSYRIRTHARMNSVGSETVSLNSKVPVLGVNMLYEPFPTLRIYGEALGMSLDRGGVHSRIFEGYAGADYLLIGQVVALTVGYRYATLNGDEQDEAKFDLKQKGLYTGFVIRL